MKKQIMSTPDILMYNGKTFLAIIPARSGSKGLPGKNIKKLCGKPLVAWSIEAALKSRFLDEVMVTTDDQKIADISKKHGAKVPFLRPCCLSCDETTTVDVVKHTIWFYRVNLGRTFDYIVLLEPTSPLRSDNDIDMMIKKLCNDESQFDSIISVGAVHEHPSIMKKIVKDEYLESYCADLKEYPRRQDNDLAYFPYGVAYIIKVSTLLDEGTFYSVNNTFFVIKRFQCYEIDDIYDFLAIESIMNYEIMEGK